PTAAERAALYARSRIRRHRSDWRAEPALLHRRAVGHQRTVVCSRAPANGELGWVAPAFEKDRTLEQIQFGTDVRTWQEDENPYELVAAILKDRGLRSGRLGIEETVQFRFSDGIAKAAPAVRFTSADPVTARCRGIKSLHEV